MGNSCSRGCRWWCVFVGVYVLSFFPLDVFDEIWELIESVSEGFLTYSFFVLKLKNQLGKQLLHVKVPVIF